MNRVGVRYAKIFTSGFRSLLTTIINISSNIEKYQTSTTEISVTIYSRAIFERARVTWAAPNIDEMFNSGAYVFDGRVIDLRYYYTYICNVHYTNVDSRCGRYIYKEITCVCVGNSAGERV